MTPDTQMLDLCIAEARRHHAARNSPAGIRQREAFAKFRAEELDRQNEAFVMGLFVKVAEVVK